MSTIFVSPPASRPSLIAALLPIMGVVFVAFLITGLAMPVLPLHVHYGLGLSTFAVGLVAGAQFAAALVSRVWSGRCADGQGAKRAVVIGLVLASAAGVIYHLSLLFVTSPATSATMLLAGRVVFGGAESFIITGALSWGVQLGGPRNIGKVMAWIGMAMYVAFAVGAPLGTALYSRYGFFAIALATTAIPIACMALVAPLDPIAPSSAARPALSNVINAVWVPGIGLALSSIGFGAITTFIALLYADRGWSSAWLAFTGFSLAFVAARVFFGHLSDKVGGAKVALICVLIEGVGLSVIWLAPNAPMAFLGAALTGSGYSLVYPAFGVEAVRRAPPESKGLAMGTYTAFLDLALGLSSPVLGLIAHRAGIASIFFASALTVLCSSAIAFWLVHANRLNRLVKGT